MILELNYSSTPSCIKKYFSLYWKGAQVSLLLLAVAWAVGKH